MKILVLGAAGMIGRKLIDRLLVDGTLRGEAITALHAFDIMEAPRDATGSIAFSTSAGDIADKATVDALIEPRPDIVFHFAAIVSGEAEADFEKGYRINFDGTRHLFDAIVERDGYVPRVVYASSIAVFGAPFPDTIDDGFHLTPLTSYGTQKAIGEMLLADYTRRGMMDGIGLRFPTIVVRPGKPNAAASGFFSNIIREPLVGQDAVLPVSRDVMHWLASPRSAIGFAIHAAEIDGDVVGPRRNLTLPGLAITVGEMIEGLERVAGPQAVAHIKEISDETIEGIVANWPRRFDAQRAEGLGFVAEKSFDDVVRAHIEDELGGTV
ncbi:MAG: D-erythronate dehydrogenase [Pseudomonadota bacterium]